MRVTVLLTPDAAAIPARATAVIVDVLRATTSLSVALAHGARRVLPVAGPEEAHRLRSLAPDARLCGERDGKKLPGFDLGNSPAEYGADAVAGRSLIFASTNGSRAMISARTARRRILGAFVNGSAVARAVEGEREVVIVCAGKLGDFCLEDASFAGWLCERLAERGARVTGESARFARSLAPRDRNEVPALLQGCAQGRHLRDLGAEFAGDVEFCAGLDRMDQAFEI